LSEHKLLVPAVLSLTHTYLPEQRVVGLHGAAVGAPVGNGVGSKVGGGDVGALVGEAVDGVVGADVAGMSQRAGLITRILPLRLRRTAAENSQSWSV